jgi:hypothetical protein
MKIDRGLDDVAPRRTRRVENGFQVGEDAICLRNDIAGDDLPRYRVERNLTSGEKKAIGNDTLRVWPDGGWGLVRLYRR